MPDPMNIEPLRSAFLSTAKFIAHSRVEYLSATAGQRTEALITLRDVARLDTADAKQVMLHAARWMLEGALADAASKARSAQGKQRS